MTMSINPSHTPPLHGTAYSPSCVEDAPTQEEILSTPPPPGEATRRLPSELRFLRTLQQMRSLEEDVIGNCEERLKEVKSQVHATSQEQLQQLKKRGERSQSGTMWGTLQKITNCFSASLSLITGGALLFHGHACAGKSMVAAGLFSLSSLAIQETLSWDWVATQLTEEAETQKKIAAIAPFAMGILSGGATVASSICFYYSAVPSILQTAMPIIQSTLSFLNTGIALGKGYADSRVIAAQSDLKTIEGTLTEQQLQFQTIMEEIGHHFSAFRTMHKYAKNAIEALGSSQTRLTR